MRAQAGRLLIAAALVAGVVAGSSWWAAPPVQHITNYLQFDGLFSSSERGHEALAREFFETQKVIATSQSLCLSAADLLLARGVVHGGDGKRTQIATDIRRELRANHVAGSRILTLSFADRDAAYAQAVAGAVVTAYLMRLQMIRPAAAAPDSELGQATLEVDRAERALGDFVKAQPVPLTEEYLSVLGGELSQYSQALSSSRIRAIETGVELVQIESALEKGTLRAARLQNDPSFKLLRAKHSELLMERALAAARGETPTRLDMLDTQLKALTFEMAERGRALAEEVKSELQVAREQQQRIAGEVDRVKLLVSELELHRMELARLQRRLDAQHKLFEAQAGQSIDSARASVAWSARQVDQVSGAQRLPPVWAAALFLVSAAMLAGGISLERSERERKRTLATAQGA